MPFYAVQILYDMNNRDVPITSDNRGAQVSTAPAAIDTGVIIVDESNYEYFLRK
jgi:hypothetical protein